jgi:16S rRNA (cytosine967-C5)-methyltransferase
MSDPTREAAFHLLSSVLDERRTLDTALAALSSLAPRDRAAAHRLAAATLRHLGALDAVLDAHLRRAPPPEVRHILRLGAAALLLLDTPPHAAVATAVALARRRGFVPFTGLVNAVLRRIAQGGKALLADLDLPRLDTPSWLWRSWGEQARAIALQHHREPPLDLTWVGEKGTLPVGFPLPNGSWRLPPGTAVTELEGFSEGRFFVQDVAASLPARLLAVRPGERVADLCAAPGGKTAQLAAAGAHVVALDRDPERLERLEANLSRLRLAAQVVAADAVLWRSETAFDAVLLDAPCSGTGTIRRHPDIPHLRRPADLAPLTALQDALLEAAVRLLRPGGRLVYAVCSLQPEEGRERIAAALQRLPVRRFPFAPGELPFLPEALTAEGDLFTHPGLWAEWGGMDGFFAARLIKTARGG